MTSNAYARNPPASRSPVRPRDLSGSSTRSAGRPGDMVRSAIDTPTDGALVAGKVSPDPPAIGAHLQASRSRCSVADDLAQPESANTKPARCRSEPRAA